MVLLQRQGHLNFMFIKSTGQKKIAFPDRSMFPRLTLTHFEAEHRCRYLPIVPASTFRVLDL